MLKLVKVVQDFIRQSNIQLNPKKWEILKIGKDNYTRFPLMGEFTVDTTQLDCVNDKKLLDIWELPLVKAKSAK
jgi:hypothetical protein